MGGTSTDVSLVDGVARHTTEASVDGYPIRVPMLDIHTVGAAWEDRSRRVDAAVGCCASVRRARARIPAPLVTERARRRRSPTRMSCWAASALRSFWVAR